MSEQRWVRSQRATAVDLGGEVVLVGRDGQIFKLEGDSAELARVVLGFLGQARSEREVLAHVEAVSGAPLGERVRVVRELIALLSETGTVTSAPAIAANANAATAGRPVGLNVVVGVTGAIAATAAPALIAALQRRGHTVEVCVTPTAQRFVALDALTALVQREVATSMWPRAPHQPVPHVALAAWADLVIIYPASGTTIARIAHGEFSELVAAVALTTRAPVVLVPSLNEAMLAASPVQRNLDQLREDGFAIVHGVPSHEVSDAPSVRDATGGAAPAPTEVVSTIETLRGMGLFAPTRGRWDHAYRGMQVPWASDTCDADIAAALAEHAPGGRLLDLGCGLGQVARHAARAGYRVVATDIAESALALARDGASPASGSMTRGVRKTAPNDDVVWLRDDICTSGLVGPFDVIVDRATLHALSPLRAHAWAATVTRITHAGSIVIVKVHRDGVAPATRGLSAQAIAALLPDFAIVAEHAAELPGLVDATPIASVLVVLRRR